MKVIHGGKSDRKKDMATPTKKLMAFYGYRPLIVTIAFTILGSFGLVVFAWVMLFDFHTNQMQGQLNLIAKQTQAGEFAVENFYQCKSGNGVLSSKKSEAECINQVVSAATTLKGDAFSREVVRDLSGWLDETKKLQAERAEERYIANYIAKHF